MSDLSDDELDAVDAGVGGTTAPEAVPGDNATDPERRAWLEWAFTVPDGSRVGEITRYGATRQTPMTIEILPPGGGRARLVRFEDERDAERHGTLRATLIRDAGVKAAHITNAKIAGDAYYVLCKLGRVVGPVDPRDEVREWLDGYRFEARRTTVSFAKGDLYGTLDALRRFPYSKRQINVWLAAIERLKPNEPAPAEPRPPLLVDAKGGEWTSITHLATYVRWGRDQAGVITNAALAGRVVELGGTRWRASAWDQTTRDRQSRITTVLVRFPDPTEDDSGDDGPEAV